MSGSVKTIPLVDIIGVVQDDQKQNSVKTQPQSATDLQGQADAVPVIDAGSGVQGQGGSSLLFNNTYDAGSLLNQTQVVGTGQVDHKEEPMNEPQTSKGALIFDVLIAIAIVLVLAWVFRLMAKMAERRG